MTPRILLCCALIGFGALIGRVTAAPAGGGLIQEQEVLNNDSVRIVLITYRPGADSDLHLNVSPEITLVQEGELALYANGAREALGPRTARWLAKGTAHLTRNEGKRPVRFWSVLLKKSD
jgi:quercetin dioxygenase-like cupin family protein